MKRIKDFFSLYPSIKISVGIVSFLTILLLQFPESSFAQNSTQSFGLYFSVDYQDSLGLYRDEPAILTVSISNPAAAYGTAWNKEALSYLAELETKFKAGDLSEEAYQKERKSVVDGMVGTYESRVGTSSKPWASKVEFKIIREDGAEMTTLPNRLLKSSKPVNVAVLNENSYFSAEFNLLPNGLKSLASGTYHFIASIDNVESAPVRLDYKSELMPKAVRNSESMLLKIGQYHLQDENPNEALDYAQQILKRNANSLEGLVLRGDSYLLMEKNNNALSDYERALDLFYQEYPDSYEEPEYLLSMIEYLKGK